MLDAQQMEISHTENGDLVIHPIKNQRGNLLLAALTQFDGDFIEALEHDASSPQTMLP